MVTIDVSGESYLYLLESNGLYKIGFSNNPQARAKRLQTGSPCPIRVLFMMQTPIFAELEEELHQKFRRKRIHGEWFALDDDDVRYITTLDFRGFTPDEVAKAQHQQRARDGLEPWTDQEIQTFNAAMARLEALFSNES